MHKGGNAFRKGRFYILLNGCRGETHEKLIFSYFKVDALEVDNVLYSWSILKIKS